MAKQHFKKGMGISGKFAGMYANDSDDELLQHEGELRDSIYDEERKSALSDFGDEGNPRNDILSDLREQFAESQRESKRRGMTEREWGYRGYSDTSLDLYIKANGARDTFTAATVKQQVNMLKAAIRQDVASNNPMGSKSALQEINDQISETEDILNRKWGV